MDLRRMGRELAALERFVAANPRDNETLGEFIERITPDFRDPTHLAPIVAALDDAEKAALGNGPPVFVCISVPPQHGKTETISHWVAKLLKRSPSILSGYVSYSAEIAEDKSRTIRDYARLAGVELRDDTNSVSLWRTPERGGLVARGILGAITGVAGLTILIVDDPFKNRLEAESRITRERVWNEFRASIWTRLRRRTSVIVVHTRWHEDDLIGRIKRDDDLAKYFRFINLPAVNEVGEALWPAEMPIELLDVKRAGSSERDWWSLYMGEPRPRESHVFKGVSYYTVLPRDLRIAIGTDLAYSSKTVADWNVAIVLGMASDERVYVLDVRRKHCSAPEWGAELKSLRARWPGAPMRAYIGGTEKGTVDYMAAAEGLAITALPARADKYTRAIPIAAKWNATPQGVLWPQPSDGPRAELPAPVLVRAHDPEESATVRVMRAITEAAPTSAPAFTADMEAALTVILDFSGQGDAHDDDVDAIAAGYDALMHVPSSTTTQPSITRERPFGDERSPARPYTSAVRPYRTGTRPF